MPLLQNARDDEERIGLGGSGIGNENLTGSNPRSGGFMRGSGIMKSIRKSFRRRKNRQEQNQTGNQSRQTQKPNEWLQDELKVKNGTCQFKVSQDYSSQGGAREYI